ncbi:hypothetical protein [Nocardioides limicola]|uniref:hypothetical protein n=1 Tax=Nocardioides limicola TaxID=2803368 RepID=UPI00193BB616|nr:hypothetical protein [Nocardioides sp. DJM-14]
MNLLSWLADRPVSSLWLVVVLPFFTIPTVLISPLVLPEDATWAHATFHLVYLPVIALAIALMVTLLRAPSRSHVRKLYALILACQSAAAFGHAGELVVTIREGFFAAPEAVFEQADHMFFANFAVFGLMLSVLVVIATSIVIGVDRARARRRVSRSVPG